MFLHGARPVFVSGRQHSGNTLVTNLIAGLDNFYGLSKEASFFDERKQLTALSPLDGRLSVNDCIFRSGKVDEDDSGYLKSLAENEQDLEIDAYYCKAMDMLSRRHLSDRWVQKGTSLVFFAEDIVKIFPEARILFLLRNPIDLAISWRKRNSRANLLRFSMGWNQGVGKAVVLQERMPKNFRIFRYEDMIFEPEITFRAISEFLNIHGVIDWKMACHTNSADQKHKVQKDKPGFSKDPVYRFRRETLSSDISSVFKWIRSSLFLDLYPELESDWSAIRKKTSTLDQVTFFCGNFFDLLRDVGVDWKKSPSHLVSRTWKRIRPN